MISNREESLEDMVSDTKHPVTNANVGDRIECSGHLGTIKYIGPVETHSSVWLGIDWDDELRGKHNGNVNDVQYFTARCETSGSFVRPEKVEYGHSIIVSIMKRYGSRESEETMLKHQQNLHKFQQSINAPFLEMVGFEKVLNKQSNFDLLKVVNLRLQNISSSGEAGQLKQLCPNIEELDLSKNLFGKWTSIFEICTQLERLTWLNLSENRLEFPKTIEYSFPKLETLICTSMNLVWEDVLRISEPFPNVRELRVPLNNIKSLNTPPNVLKNLRILDIEDNYIENWDEVCKLTVLENLEELLCGNIGLKKIEFPDKNGDKTDFFETLRKLSISQNLIDNWDSVNELNRMKNLDDLRFVKNPILETQSEGNRFQIVVARIGNLKIFNGTEIKSDSRRGAEYDYMKMYGLEWLKVRDTPECEEFLKHHNRYLELVELYGAPEESELIVKPKNIKNTLVTLILEHENHSVTKKLPLTLIVQKLMVLVQKTFKLDYRPNLIYVSGVDPSFTISLEEERDLGFYSMQDGDKIIIS